MNDAVTLARDLPELSFSATGGSLVRRTVLPSGVRILSEQVPGARSATVGYWVAAGSRDEVPGTFGATHFLEHLLFKGTPSRTALDIAISFDAVGGEHNAMTAKEYTCYYAKVQDTDLGMAIEVIADMLTSSLIDPTEFANERGVILEELAMADDDPTDVASERFFEAVFGDHPLGRPIGGNPETINAISRDSVIEHYRDNYRPQDLVVTVAGAVDHDVLVAAISTSLESAGWDLSTQATPVTRRVSASHRSVSVRTTGAAERLQVTHRPTEQANIVAGVEGLSSTDERRATLTVLNSILGSGMSSRLFQEVREKRGLAYSVYSFAPSYSDAGIFGIYAGCSPAKSAQVAELMLDEFTKMAEARVTDEEIRRAIGQLRGASALALEDSDSRMSRLGRSELTLGEFLDLDASIARISAVTAEGIQDLARELSTRPLSIAAVGAVTEEMFSGLTLGSVAQS